MPEISEAELAELQKHKESVAKLEAKNKELLEESKAARKAREDAEAAKAKVEEEKLKESGNYKELAEKYAAREAEREASDKRRDEQFKLGAKLQKAREELLKIGADPKVIEHALKMVDLEQVKYDENTKTAYGADLVAAALKTAVPHLFVKKDSERIPGGDDTDPPAGGEMTDEWFYNLSVKDQSKYRAKFLASKGITIRPKA